MKWYIYILGFIFLILISSNYVNALPTASNLLHYYPLEDCTAGGIDARLELTNESMFLPKTGSPTVVTSASATLGNACKFSGTGQYLRNQSQLVDSKKIRTIEFWYNDSSTNKCMVALGNATWAKDQIDVFIDPSYRLYFYAMSNSATIFDGSTYFSTAGTTNTWNHYVLVMNGVNWTVYRNNVSISVSQSSLPLNFEGIAIGGEMRAGTNLMTGSIDNLAIWDYAFEPADVEWAYNSFSGRNYTLELNPPTPQPCVPISWNITNSSLKNILSVSAKETAPMDVYFKPDGLKMYTIGQTGDTIDEYNLSVAWNITTAVYSKEKSTSPTETTPRGLSITSDGTKAYVIGQSSDAISEWNFGTPWDISTLTLVQMNSTPTNPDGLFIDDNGVNVLITRNADDSIYWFIMSTPFNISTLTYKGVLSVTTKDATPFGVYAKPDGTKMYVVGFSDKSIDEYDLSVAWNITTAIYSQEYAIPSNVTSPHGLYMRDDGLKFYIMDYGFSTVNEFDMGTICNADACTYSGSGDWIINNTQCNITIDTNVLTNNLIIENSTVLQNVTVSNFTNFWVQPGSIFTRYT